MRGRSCGKTCGKGGDSLAFSPLSIDHRKSLKRDLSMDNSIDYRIYRVDDDSSKSQRKQRAIAERLLNKLEEPSSWKFYLKCAYHLSEAEIDRLLTSSMKPNIKDHNRYFVRIADKAMAGK